MRHLFLGLAISLGCGPKAKTVHPMPTVQALPSFKAPTVEMASLDNGLNIWLVKDNRLPLIQVRFVFPANSGQDPIGRGGLNSLMMQMLDESAGGQSSAARSAAFRDLAAKAGSWTSKSGNVVSLRCHKKVFSSAMALLSQSITAADFNESDWKRIKEAHIDAIKQNRESERTLATISANALFYGDNHPLGRPTMGTTTSATAIELKDVKELYSEAIKPNGATMVVAGDIDMATLKAELKQHLPTWEGGDVTRVEPDQAAVIKGPKLILVDSKGAAQTTIRGMAVGPNVLEKDALPADLAAIVLGGSFTSRLNALLREKKGYTYGASASFGGGHQNSALIVYTSVRKDATTKAMIDILSTLTDMKNGLSDNEIAKAKSQFLNDLIETKASLTGTVGIMHNRLIEGESFKSWAGRMEDYDSVSADSINAVAAQRFNPDQMMFVLVGDIKSIRPELESLQIPIRVYTPK